MFKNPGKKLSGVVKAMFWVLSILYILFDVGIAVFASLMAVVLDGALVAASSAMAPYSGNTSMYSGGASVAFIVFIIVMAIISIIPVILILYWVTLFILSVAEMNTEIKEVKSSVQTLEEVCLQGGALASRPTAAWSDNSFQQNSYQYQQPQQTVYQQPQPTYQEPLPVYQTQQPEMYFAQEPQMQPVQQTAPAPQQIVPEELNNLQSITESPTVVVETQKAEDDTENTSTDASPQKELSKEDILKMYGPKGNYYSS